LQKICALWPERLSQKARSGAAHFHIVKLHLSAIGKISIYFDIFPIAFDIFLFAAIIDTDVHP
jgi:hypothetical protein